MSFNQFGPYSPQERSMTLSPDTIHQFSAADEARHPAGSDPWWQESVAFHWYDAGSGAGGMHRIGHEPNQDGGVIAHHHGVFDPDHRWRRNVRAPMGGQLDEAGFGDAAASWAVEEGTPRFRVATDDCELDLRIEDIYGLTDFFPRGNASLTEEFAAHHYETSGIVQGTFRLGERTHQIDGFCHRDHSWGTRLWKDALASHRWISGVFGPDLAFGSIVWNGPDGSLARGGYIVRDGSVQLADSADVVTWLEVDGTTHRGGELTLSFGDEKLQFTCRAIDGWLNEHHGVAWVDELCEVEHDGRIGYCDFEISTNPRMGTAPVRLCLAAAAADGLHPRG
jgi:hypothetical protein